MTGSAKCDGTEGNGKCTDDLAKWLNESDLRADRPGVQNVTSYWIGFGDDVASGTAFLEKVAQRGGGKYYAAADTAELTEAFSEIISKILEQTTTFTSPTVAVNAFNRTQNLNYLYMSVFKPATSYRWLGNIKKYRVTQDGEIRDVNDNAAVDPNNGFFATGSQSFWSDMADGADAEMGGAAGELKNPGDPQDLQQPDRQLGDADRGPVRVEDAGNLTLANLLLLGVVSNVAVVGPAARRRPRGLGVRSRRPRRERQQRYHGSPQGHGRSAALASGDGHLRRAGGRSGPYPVRDDERRLPAGDQCQDG